jgi:hypothetical protein
LTEFNNLSLLVVVDFVNDVVVSIFSIPGIFNILLSVDEIFSTGTLELSDELLFIELFLFIPLPPLPPNLLIDLENNTELCSIFFEEEVRCCILAVKISSTCCLSCGDSNEEIISSQQCNEGSISLGTILEIVTILSFIEDDNSNNLIKSIVENKNGSLSSSNVVLNSSSSL